MELDVEMGSSAAIAGAAPSRIRNSPHRQRVPYRRPAELFQNHFILVQKIGDASPLGTYHHQKWVHITIYNNIDKMEAKTYNTEDSQVVTDPSTNSALCCLYMGERTGSLVFSRMWSYVLDIPDLEVYIPRIGFRLWCISIVICEVRCNMRRFTARELASVREPPGYIENN